MQGVAAKNDASYDLSRARASVRWSAGRARPLFSPAIRPRTPSRNGPHWHNDRRSGPVGYHVEIVPTNCPHFASHAHEEPCKCNGRSEIRTHESLSAPHPFQARGSLPISPHLAGVPSDGAVSRLIAHLRTRQQSSVATDAPGRLKREYDGSEETDPHLTHGARRRSLELGPEPHGSADLGFRGLFLSILGPTARLERMQQTTRDLRDLLHRG
jgi:hypothetical protein